MSAALYDHPGMVLCATCGHEHVIGDGNECEHELEAQRLERDAGADRDTRPEKPCCRRFAPGRWCSRDADHDGNCYGPLPREHAAPDYTRGMAPRPTKDTP